MIRLFCPLTHNGYLIPAGKTVCLPKELEEKIVAAGNGKRVVAMDVSEDWFEGDDPPTKEPKEQESAEEAKPEESPDLLPGVQELPVGRKGRK
ncbi:hypothetical protein C814_03475 [Anaerotruncus sp. G3(2012)]|uniref:hypothetical protein n=1 Tax=Anaerotruncus sp. G3(2012) TaxID=1235835 RepID=UPI00033BE318|nr:hypothetical protein [Anaerotruncus sp. G3(2012)]EOS53943.1 hypothetical protein C814_03475 [Anaerotruncus sp. G3(2012)]